MKRIVMAAALVALVGFGAQAAVAGDDHHKHDYSRRHGDYQRYHRDHDRLQDQLERRAFEREMRHREAHRHPMTPKQHERLHERLERQEFRDIMKHEKFHQEAPKRYRSLYHPHSSLHHHHPAPHPTGGGIGIQGRNVSFWIGL